MSSLSTVSGIVGESGDAPASSTRSSTSPTSHRSAASAPRVRRLVEELPDELLQDPILARSGGTDRGRDGCRVPLPWSGKEPPSGFGTGTSWPPQPTDRKNLTVESQ